MLHTQVLNKRPLLTVIIILLLMALIGSVQAQEIPTLTIDTVESDQNVTITATNFLATQEVVVTMGRWGSLGVDGPVVGTIMPNSDGSFSGTFDIPEELRGQANIAIRGENEAGYHAYNWFVNIEQAPSDEPPTENLPESEPDAPATPSQPVGIPSFEITAVTVGESVSIRTDNFPPNQYFTVTMRQSGTPEDNAIVVDTTQSGSGGSFDVTYTIPEELAPAWRIEMKMTSDSGLYAFNGFNNLTAVNLPATPEDNTDDTTSEPESTPDDTTTSGPPTMEIMAVVQDETVMLELRNLSRNQNYTILMGPMGTLGIDGTEVANLNSGEGGTQELTVEIPTSLLGMTKIAIRMESASGYTQYDWFNNVTTP